MAAPTRELLGAAALARHAVVSQLSCSKVKGASTPMTPCCPFCSPQIGSVWWSRLRTTAPRGSCHAEKPQNAPYEWSHPAIRVHSSSARRRRLAGLGHCARPERRSPGSVARRTTAACHPGTSAGIGRDRRTHPGLDPLILRAGRRCSEGKGHREQCPQRRPGRPDEMAVAWITIGDVDEEGRVRDEDRMKPHPADISSADGTLSGVRPDASSWSCIVFTVLIPASAGERPIADDVSSGDELAPCTLPRPDLRPR